jgi:hypothetical protein
VLLIPETSTSIPVTHALHFLAILWRGVGFLIAGTGARSAFGMLNELMTILFPATRVAGFIWLIVAGAQLRRLRHHDG